VATTGGGGGTGISTANVGVDAGGGGGGAAQGTMFSGKGGDGTSGYVQVVCPLVSMETEATAFFARASITDATQQAAVNGYVKALKHAGLWTKMTALYPFVGGTAAAHAQNLISSSHTITWFGGMTHDSMGATATNGGVGYGNTGINVNTLNTLNFHLSAYPTTDFAPGCDLMGSFSTVQGIMGIEGNFQASGGSLTYDCNSLSEGRLAASYVNTLSHHIVSRTSATSGIGYNRGAEKAAKTTTCTNPSWSSNLIIFGRNDNGAWLHYYGTMCMASIGKGLTGAEARAFYNATQNFQLALGRAIA
jgi:hypothetical protein